MSQAFAGGILIGMSALLLYGALGKIAGISGIFFGALERAEMSWRLPFLLGLAGGGWLAAAAGVAVPASAVPGAMTPLLMLVAAGLLVGYGTRLGNGCTSGHGICGLARLSPRSLVAVIVFMAAGLLVATLVRPLLLAP